MFSSRPLMNTNTLIRGQRPTFFLFFLRTKFPFRSCEGSSASSHIPCTEIRPVCPVTLLLRTLEVPVLLSSRRRMDNLVMSSKYAVLWSPLIWSQTQWAFAVGFTQKTRSEFAASEMSEQKEQKTKQKSHGELKKKQPHLFWTFLHANRFICKCHWLYKDRAMSTTVCTDDWILFVLMLHWALQHFIKSDCTFLQGLDVMLRTCRVLITSFEGIVSNAAEISLCIYTQFINTKKWVWVWVKYELITSACSSLTLTCAALC